MRGSNLKMRGEKGVMRRRDKEWNGWRQDGEGRRKGEEKVRGRNGLAKGKGAKEERGINLYMGGSKGEQVGRIGG